MGLPLVVVGEGELYDQLQSIACDNVRILGRQPFEIIKDLLQKCKGLIFPGVEDFGIVPIEAMAAGAPVVAYARGGALETVKDGITGVYFYEQSVDAIVDAVDKIESGRVKFDPASLHSYAAKFSKETFQEKVKSFIDGCTY
jgi:glycosyltransferase involved in cell wall biosynthesis